MYEISFWFVWWFIMYLPMCAGFQFISANKVQVKITYLRKLSRREGKLPFYYTSPQSFILFVGLTTLGIYLILIGWFIKLSVQTFKLLIVIYRKDNFVHHKKCILIYQPLSYPFYAWKKFFNFIIFFVILLQSNE